MSMMASLSLDALSSEGEQLTVRVEVGAPYFSDRWDTWACPITIDPIYERLADAVGEDSFQSLCLAIRLAHSLLRDFVDKGGTLLMDGEPFPFEAYFDGVGSAFR